MAQSFKETAHLKTDQKAFEEGWERIFGKKDEIKEVKCIECSGSGSVECVTYSAIYPSRKPCSCQESK